jgi:phosphoglycolate phosphatase-like HAD superfamily hydrolase
VTCVRADLSSTAAQAPAGRTRRELLRVIGTALPAAAIAGGENAYGFSRQEMPAEVSKSYRDHCATDSVHAPSLEAAFARLDAAGIKYDRKAIAASLRCPICGCSIISNIEAAPDTGRAPPSF